MATKFFDCEILYSDKTISKENLCATKTPIAIIVTPPGFAAFPVSLLKPDQSVMNIEQAEAFAEQYQTLGTTAGDWGLMTTNQIRTIAAQARTIQGILLELAECGLAKKLDWGVYYLCRRMNRDQRYLTTTGIPCGQIHEIPNTACDHIRLTIKQFDKWLKA